MLAQTKVLTLLELSSFKGLTASSSFRKFANLCPGLCCFSWSSQTICTFQNVLCFGLMSDRSLPTFKLLSSGHKQVATFVGFDWFSCCCLDELQQFFGHTNTFRYTDHITLTVISCSVPFNNIHRIRQWSRTPPVMTAEESKEKAHLQHGSQKSQM